MEIIMRAVSFLGLSSLAKLPWTWHSLHITPKAWVKETMVARRLSGFNNFKFVGCSNGLGPFLPFFSSWANNAKQAISTTVSTFIKRMGISYAAVRGKASGGMEIFLGSSLVRKGPIALHVHWGGVRGFRR